MHGFINYARRPYMDIHILHQTMYKVLKKIFENLRFNLEIEDYNINILLKQSLLSDCTSLDKRQKSLLFPKKHLSNNFISYFL